MYIKVISNTNPIPEDVISIPKNFSYSSGSPSIEGTWTAEDISEIKTKLSNILDNQNAIISQLAGIGEGLNDIGSGIAATISAIDDAKGEICNLLSQILTAIQS